MEDNIETPADNEIIVRYEGPSVKDQAVSALVGVGITLAVGAAYVGAVYAVQGVGTLVSNVKSRRAAKKASKESTTTTDSE